MICAQLVARRAFQGSEQSALPLGLPGYQLLTTNRDNWNQYTFCMPTHAELCAGSKILHSKGKTVYLEGLSELCQINSMCLETIQKTEISIRTVKEQSSSWRSGKACGKSKQNAVFSCDTHAAFSLKSQDPGMHQIQGKNR